MRNAIAAILAGLTLVALTGCESDAAAVDLNAIRYQADTARERIWTLTRDGVASDLPVGPRTTYAWQFDHVMDVLQGRAAPLTGGADAIATMTAIDAIRAAAAQA